MGQSHLNIHTRLSILWEAVCKNRPAKTQILRSPGLKPLLARLMDNFVPQTDTQTDTQTDRHTDRHTDTLLIFISIE